MLDSSHAGFYLESGVGGICLHVRDKLGPLGKEDEEELVGGEGGGEKREEGGECEGSELALQCTCSTWTLELVELVCMSTSLTAPYCPLSRSHWALVSSVQARCLVRR